MQGKAFREMRAKLMNCAVHYTDNMMVTVTDSICQKPTEDAQETLNLKWEKSEISTREKIKLDWYRARRPMGTSSVINNLFHYLSYNV